MYLLFVASRSETNGAASNCKLSNSNAIAVEALFANFRTALCVTVMLLATFIIRRL